MFEEVMEYFNNLYPDRAVVDNVDEFTRIKDAGKIELLREIARFMEDEYGKKQGVNNG